MVYLLTHAWERTEIAIIRMVRFYLEILNGPHSAQRLWVQLGQVMSIGSSERADVALEGDADLREVHFRLVHQRSGCYVETVDPQTTLFVDEMETDRCRLRDGHTLRAGMTQFRVIIAGTTEGADLPSTPLPETP